MFKRFAGRVGAIFGAAGLSCMASLALACTGITLTGTGSSKGDRILVSKVTDLKSIYGKKPGTQNG